ncbi:MAG: glycosyltransferase family 2 protein [Syntrophaceae bacterium]|nr:glycosyltransferase family 2 protein [Syntrophaceae bacterium]
MANSPFEVDVVIPVYNGAEFVGEAIESVLKQKESPYSIIVVNDCSTDQTMNVLEGFGTRIRVLQHEKNRGLPAARNTGIRAGNSGLIAFLDADDAWAEEKNQKQIQEFRDVPEIGLCYTDVADCDSKLNPIRSNRGFRRRKGETVFSELYLKAFPIPPSTVMVRREVFHVCGLFNESMRETEDFECWLRIAMKFPISCLPEALCRRRNNPHSITNTSRLDREVHYRLRAFDLCAEAAQRWKIPLPMELMERKRLYFYRRLRESIRWHESQAEAFFRAQLVESGGLSLLRKTDLRLLKIKENIKARMKKWVL